MAGVFKIYNEKGFQIVKLTRTQLASIGSPCICDSCAKTMENSVFIGALNKAFCIVCYEAWNYRAVFYDEDKPYEKMATQRLLDKINSQLN